LERDLEQLIASGDLNNHEEKRQAELNLKTLRVYQVQQEVRSLVLRNYINNQIALDACGKQTLGDLMY
jgi:hypothetical protein